MAEPITVKMSMKQPWWFNRLTMSVLAIIYRLGWEWPLEASIAAAATAMAKSAIIKD